MSPQLRSGSGGIRSWSRNGSWGAPPPPRPPGSRPAVAPNVTQRIVWQALENMSRRRGTRELFTDDLLDTYGAPERLCSQQKLADNDPRKLQNQVNRVQARARQLAEGMRRLPAGRWPREFDESVVELHREIVRLRDAALWCYFARLGVRNYYDTAGDSSHEGPFRKLQGQLRVLNGLLSTPPLDAYTDVRSATLHEDARKALVSYVMPKTQNYAARGAQTRAETRRDVLGPMRDWGYVLNTGRVPRARDRRRRAARASSAPPATAALPPAFSGSGPLAPYPSLPPGFYGTRL